MAARTGNARAGAAPELGSRVRPCATEIPTRPPPGRSAAPSTTTPALDRWAFFFRLELSAGLALRPCRSNGVANLGGLLPRVPTQLFHHRSAQHVRELRGPLAVETLGSQDRSGRYQPTAAISTEREGER